MKIAKQISKAKRSIEKLKIKVNVCLDVNFIYTINPEDEDPILLINKHIGYDDTEGAGIMGDQFQSELMYLDKVLNKRSAQVWITSEGGSVIDGEKIYSSILHAKMKVDTYCMGMAASIAAVIFQAGRRRYMADFGKLMFHEVSGSLPSELEVFNKGIATMIAKRAGKTEEEVLSLMYQVTWMLAPEAEEKGFCDDILESSEANKGRLSKLTNIKEFNKHAVLIMNKAVDEKKQLSLNFKPKKNMNRIANILNLNPEASDEAIALEITKLKNKKDEAENKAKDSEEKTKELQDKFEKAKKELDEHKEELDKMKNEFEKKDKEAKEKEEEAKKEKAKNLVKIHVDRKAISNKAEIVDMWIADAVTNYENAKIKLESIPVNNKEYVSIENKATQENYEFPIVDKRKSYANVVVAAAHVINSRKK